MKQLINEKLSFPKWTQPILNILKELNEKVYVKGELVYKPFFNEKYGPILNQAEIELIIPNNAELINSYLANKHPEYRWKVIKGNVEELLAKESFIFLASAICIDGDGESLFFGHEKAEEHLLKGLIEPTLAYTKNDMEKAIELFNLYPGCSSRYFQLESHFEQTTWNELEEEIHANEVGGRFCEDELTEKESKIALKILKWHKENKKEKELVPIPQKGKMPKDNPWIAKDEEFREWIIQQTLIKGSLNKQDDYLEYVLELQKMGGQKPTHDGWKVYLHSIMSVLQINTEGLDPEIKRVLRLVMIWHDVGKLRNVWTPGAHGAIGSKIWKKPDWLTQEEEELVKLLIKSHDYFGLMDRWIQDKNFKGGLSPKKIRKVCQGIRNYEPRLVLELMKRVYEADISSVSRLRFFLPLTPLLEEIILTEM